MHNHHKGYDGNRQPDDLRMANPLRSFSRDSSYINSHYMPQNSNRYNQNEREYPDNYDRIRDILPSYPYLHDADRQTPFYSPQSYHSHYKHHYSSSSDTQQSRSGLYTDDYYYYEHWPREQSWASDPFKNFDSYSQYSEHDRHSSFSLDSSYHSQHEHPYHTSAQHHNGSPRQLQYDNRHDQHRFHYQQYQYHQYTNPTDHCRRNYKNQFNWKSGLHSKKFPLDSLKYDKFYKKYNRYQKALNRMPSPDVFYQSSPFEEQIASNNVEDLHIKEEITSDIITQEKPSFSVEMLDISSLPSTSSLQESSKTESQGFDKNFDALFSICNDKAAMHFSPEIDRNSSSLSMDSLLKSNTSNLSMSKSSPKLMSKQVKHKFTSIHSSISYQETCAEKTLSPKPACNEDMNFPILKFKPMNDLDQFYESNRFYLQSAFDSLNERSLPKPALLEDYENNTKFLWCNVPLKVKPLDPIYSSHILKILEHAKKEAYEKKSASIKHYKSLYRVWKKNFSTNHNYVKQASSIASYNLMANNVPTRPSRPVLLPHNNSSTQYRNSNLGFGYSSDSVRSEEELNRVLLSLLQSERNDPSQRWKSTLARIPSMNNNELELNYSYYKHHSELPRETPVSSFGPVGNWWTDENRFDPRPLLTMKMIFYSIYNTEDIHSRLLAFLIGCPFTSQKNANIIKGCGGLRPFSPSERILFKDKYSSLPKRFDTILKSFPNRSIGELIQFYYETKKAYIQPYKKWWASSKVSQLNMTTSSAIKSNTISTSLNNPLLGDRKRISSINQSSTDLNKLQLVPEKKKSFKSGFSWLLERPLLTYIDNDQSQKYKFAYWTPMERIILVNGIINYGFSLPKLAETLATYRHQLSSEVIQTRVRLKRRRNGQQSTDEPQNSPDNSPFLSSTTHPTKTLLTNMNKFILDPPSSSILSASSIKVELNSESEVELFVEMYSETYELSRFFKRDTPISIISDLLTQDVVETSSLIPSKTLKSISIPSRKASLPIKLSSFNFEKDEIIYSMSQEMNINQFKLATPMASRKFSLSTFNNIGLFPPNVSHWNSTTRPFALSPPLSTRLAEGSPILSAGLQTTSNLPISMPQTNATLSNFNESDCSFISDNMNNLKRGIDKKRIDNDSNNDPSSFDSHKQEMNFHIVSHIPDHICTSVFSSPTQSNRIHDSVFKHTAQTNSDSN